MTNHRAKQTTAMTRNGSLSQENKSRQEKMINIGGRPAIVPNSPKSAAGRTYSIQLGLAFAAIYIVWGSTYLAIRYAVETIPPLVTAGIRHSVAGLILLAWAWARGFRPKREHWISGFALGRFVLSDWARLASLGRTAHRIGSGCTADRN